MLTGCTGDRAASDFAAAFADDDAVATLDLTSADNQPFTGGVSGTVVAHDDLGDDEVAALGARLATYTADHGTRMRGRVDLEFDDFVAHISGDVDRDADAVGLMLELRADPRIASGSLAEGGGPAVVTVHADEALSLAGELSERVHAAGLDGRSSLHVSSADGAVDLAGADGEWIAAASALWSALARLAPTGIRADPERIVITLARESDLDAARGLASTAVPSPGIPIRFASDVVRLGDSDGAAARSLLASLTAAQTERILTVWESENRIQVTARSAADAAALVDPVRAGLASTEIADIRVQADGDPSVQLDLPGRESAAWTDAAATLVDDATVTALSVSTRAVELTVEADDPARYAPALRELAVDDARVCVASPRETACLVAAEHVEDAGADERERAFIDAWNASG